MNADTARKMSKEAEEKIVEERFDAIYQLFKRGVEKSAERGEYFMVMEANDEPPALVQKLVNDLKSEGFVVQSQDSFVKDSETNRVCKNYVIFVDWNKETTMPVGELNE